MSNHHNKQHRKFSGTALESIRSLLRIKPKIAAEGLKPIPEFDRLLQGINEAIVVTDAVGKINLINPAAARLLASSEADLLGRSLIEVFGDDWLERDSAFSLAVSAGNGETISIDYTRSNLIDRDNRERLVYCLHASSRQRGDPGPQTPLGADALTGLADRRRFQQLLQQRLSENLRERSYFALLCLDVDSFKDVNDNFGHAAGDACLERFANTIVDALPLNAVAGRLAGDEFAVLVDGTARIDELMQELNALSRRLLKAAGSPFFIGDDEIILTTSIGIAVHPRDGGSDVELLKNADAALSQAKSAGGNCFEFFSGEITRQADRRLTLKSKLHKAFERNELRLHYQPKYGIHSARIEGAEALVRWNHPNLGLVYPADFIPLAEETNLIQQIGIWVLNRVCVDYRKWQRSLPSPCPVSVNLSLRQLRQRRFLRNVRETFISHGVSPSSLELEITETTLMHDKAWTIRMLNSLYNMGLRMAIDDFGTGYSSLSALREFPISTLKIDRSFIQHLPSDPDCATIVAAIVDMGHKLRLDIVAEGVESREQLQFLRDRGCDFAQGHLFGDPVDSEEFAALLHEDSGGTGRYRGLFLPAAEGDLNGISN